MKTQIEDFYPKELLVIGTSGGYGGGRVCMHCGRSLNGQILQATRFRCSSCHRLYDLHPQCVEQMQHRCPNCGSLLRDMWTADDGSSLDILY